VCSIAPEICIEIESSSNTLEEIKFKKELYFQAGAVEFWLCNENGEMSLFNPNGQMINSALVPEFPNAVEI
jgi:Uma2 family endonuclease